MKRRPRVWNKRDAYPGDAVYVGRPTKWGNPHPVGKVCKECSSTGNIVVHDRGTAVAYFLKDLADTPELVEAARRELRGRDLVCWCAPDPCHAYIWLVVANM